MRLTVVKARRTVDFHDIAILTIEGELGVDDWPIIARERPLTLELFLRGSPALYRCPGQREYPLPRTLAVSFKRP